MVSMNRMMSLSPRNPEQPGIDDAEPQPSQLLQRLREHPADAVSRIASEIGPRAATSVGEAQAAAYLDGRLRRAGLRVAIDAFRAPIMPGGDGVLLALIGLVSATLYGWLPLPSLLLSIWSLAIALVMFSRSGAPLLTWRRTSQNVIATRAAPQPIRQRIVLLAPLDSPPTQGWLTQLLENDLRPLVGRAVACGALTLFALIGIMDGGSIWWYAQVLPAAYMSLLAALNLQALRAPATVGAVNHAGALATLLASAEELNGIQHTELWVVGLGASNSTAGLSDLLRRYPFDHATTLFVNIEGIGAGALSYVTREGLLREHAADQLLLQQIAAVDADDPFINAEPRIYTGRRTMAHPLHAGGRRALTITCLGPDGRTPYRNSLADTADVVDAQTLERTVRLITGLVRKIDGLGG